MTITQDPISANSFVFHYLKSISGKLAKQYKSEVGKADIKDLPAGTPTFSDLVKKYGMVGQTEKKIEANKEVLVDAVPTTKSEKKKKSIEGKMVVDNVDSTTKTVDNEEASAKAEPTSEKKKKKTKADEMDTSKEVQITKSEKKKKSTEDQNEVDNKEASVKAEPTSEKKKKKKKKTKSSTE